MTSWTVNTARNRKHETFRFILHFCLLHNPTSCHLVRNKIFFLVYICLALHVSYTQEPGPTMSISHLYFCNTLRADFSDTVTDVCITLLHLWCLISQKGHVNPMLTELHWLPIAARKELKTLMLTNNWLKGLQSAIWAQEQHHPSKAVSILILISFVVQQWLNQLSKLF